MASSLKILDLIIVGGGAAGIFAAISAKTLNPKASILILEQTNAVLSKVRISGGGRCNVTNACFDPQMLIESYPRGSNELLGPFHVFQPKDMIEWLRMHKVAVKVESEGKVFPKSNSSDTIIRSFIAELDRMEIPIMFQKYVSAISKKDSYFQIYCEDASSFCCRKAIIATGGSQLGFSLAKSLGHTIIKPVPSLFSFVIKNFALHDISGITLDHVEISIPGTKLISSGSILITHTGFSGPSILKLSAFGARLLASMDYQETLSLNWLPDLTTLEIIEKILQCKQKKPFSTIANTNPFLLPKSLYKKLLLGTINQKKCQDISKLEAKLIAEKLHKDLYVICGKALHKDEFVTCGGVSLKEVDFRTLESKVCKGLFFAGEILDIDGITGGFNLQNAWTTGFIAGSNRLL